MTLALKNKRTFTGTVVSNAMDKTIVVNVERTKIHPKYKKRFTVSKNFLVHDEKNEFKVGDVVIFAETRPLSRHKRWRVIEKQAAPARQLANEAE